MSYEIESRLIEQRFNAAWGSTTPVKWDNVDYSPTADTTYIDLIIVDSNTSIVGIGGNDNMHRIRGIISMNVYAALNTGTRSGRALAEQAAIIFREAEFSSSDSSGGKEVVISCGPASITRLGTVEDWFVHNVTVPFYRNEIF